VPIIEVEHLVKHYKKAKKNAVDDISFDVKEGEFFAFLGPNGAGKTTTISILTTTLSKTSGSVRIGGFDLDQQESEVRRSIGIIFQVPSLDFNLSGEENIRVHAGLYGVYPFRPLYRAMPKTYKDRITELAAVLDMEKDLFQPVKDYSGGMKRKLEIVRSLIHDPKVLFLDEPTTGLDPQARRNLWDYLDSVRKKEGTTVFLTTHYLDEAEDADRVCIIQGGKIEKLATPAAIKSELLHDYIVMDADDRAALVKELKSKKLKVTQHPEIQVEVAGRSVQSIIDSVKTPLTTIRTHSPTLEDAYLEIIGEGAA
jgi:ABC-2 type transport system ATP-binding protein